MTPPLRLGHITFSNCLPVHARLLELPRPGDPQLVPGTPGELNRLLAAGEIDVAPCSSIEFAHHASEYVVLPDLVIGSRGPVRSIVLESDLPFAELDGRTLAMPTASATSVVLLRILLRRRWGASPREFWFDQAREDPFAAGADAALFIGDVALGRAPHAERLRADLGEEWQALTGLPFAFAVWQARREAAGGLPALHRSLLESRAYALADLESLAQRHAGRFGIPPGRLAGYWSELSYHLDAAMQEGLEAFYAMAVEIGELRAVPRMRWAGG
jgi:chorismate dehydratase